MAVCEIGSNNTRYELSHSLVVFEDSWWKDDGNITGEINTTLAQSQDSLALIMSRPGKNVYSYCGWADSFGNNAALQRKYQ